MRGEAFRNLVFWLIALTWIFLAYVAPAWSLCRLPARRQHKLAYAAYYLVLSSLVLLLSALALNIELLARGEPSSVARLFFQSFWAPGLWAEIIGTR
jgi:hypothetical protein